MLFAVSEGQASHLEIDHIEGEIEDLSLRVVHSEFNGLVPIEADFWGEVLAACLKMKYVVTLLRSLIK